MEIQLKLSNTYSKKVEVFEPLEKDKVYLYVCGITPYDFSHIGHARCYISFDVLVRVLQFFGHQTVYIRNFTDIDDKLLDKARQAGDESSYKNIAETFIADFHAQMQQLGCMSPTFEPRATECIDEMIALISNLLDKGFAYTAGNDVCFDISKVQKYGMLSGKRIAELDLGSRIEIDSNKKHPGDFVLWKGNDNGKFWQAPFGFGRPGWHIECSAMISKFCHGRPLDIHAGGYDLIFPHHENEIAQSEAAFGHQLARFWLHNAFVNIGKEKMSKSLGNSISLKDLFSSVQPMTFRFYLLQHSYTKPLEFCDVSLRGSAKPLERLSKLFAGLQPLPAINYTELLNHLQLAPVEIKQFFEQCCVHLADDLNTSAVLGLMFKNFETIETWDAEHKILLLALCQNVLGLSFAGAAKAVTVTAEVEQLIKLREEARARKDFACADALRDQLQQLGVNVQDRKL